MNKLISKMLAQFIHSAYLCITNILIYTDMDKKINEKIPIRPTSVRNAASVLKQKYHTNYSCNTDPNGITITVTRIA